MRTASWISLAAAALVLAQPAPAASQALTSLPDPVPEGRLWIDGYISRYRLGSPGSRTELNGMGARVLWTLAPRATPRRERLAEHLAIGGFISTTPADAVTNRGDVRTRILGAQLDVRPLREPFAGWIEPVLSIGAGVMRLEETHPDRWRVGNGMRLLPRDVPLVDESDLLRRINHHPVLAPSVGLIIMPMADFGLRADLRQLRWDGSRHLELATGVSLRL